MNYTYLSKWNKGRSSHAEVFLRKMARKYAANLQENTHAEVRFNHTSAWVFSCKVAAHFQNIFSQEHLRTAASVRATQMSTNKTFAKVMTNNFHENYSTLNYAEYLRERLLNLQLWEYPNFSEHIGVQNKRHLSTKYLKTKQHIKNFSIFLLLNHK